MKRFVRIAASLALLIVLLPFQSGAEGAFKNPPWHLVDVHWRLDPTILFEPFKELTMDITIEGDTRNIPPLYIAPVGLIWLDGVKAYAGLQTQLKYDHEGDEGTGLIFSRFGARRAELLREAPGGTSETAGYEGDFISVRHGMEWGPGQYVAKLTAEPEPSAPEGGRWLSFKVCLKVKNTCQKAGDLAFPTPQPFLRDYMISFVELYGPGLKEDAIPNLTITFGPPMLNGRKVEIRNADALTQLDVPFHVRSHKTPDGGVKMVIGPKRPDSDVPTTSSFHKEHVLP